MARPGLALYGTLGVLAAAGGAALLATSDHFVHPLGYAAFFATVVVGTVAVGLYWLVRRPSSRFGRLFVVLAFLYAGFALQGAHNPAIYSLGILFEVPAFLFSSYVVYAFPLGRLRRIERALMAVATFAVVSAFAPWFFLSETVEGYTPLARCKDACPHNGFLVADAPGAAAAFERLDRVLLAVVGIAIVLGLSYRMYTAKRPERRARAPVLVCMIVWALAFVVFGVARVSSSADARSVRDAGLVLTVTRGMLSVSFFVVPLLAMVFAGAALKRMITELGPRPSSSRLREVVAAALDDEELVLAFWLPSARGYIDSQGLPLTPPSPGSDRGVTEVGKGGQRVAIVHHAALTEDPELLAAAGTAILLALESGRLQAQLQRMNRELRASRMRVVSAADAERRKIERDLHDGAQQQLVALRMRLGLAEELAEGGDPDLPEVLTGAGQELDEALAELRGIAHGIYPPLLVEAGLGDALAQAGRRSGLPVTIERNGIGRYPEPVEAAVYFSCVEALQNAAKHAGEGATMRLRMWEEDGSLHFVARDDGAGFDLSRRRSGGRGLVNMEDRIGAVGGSIEITSALSEGTTIAGHVPLTA